jgi:hypothetical protein
MPTSLGRLIKKSANYETNSSKSPDLHKFGIFHNELQWFASPTVPLFKKLPS